MALSPLPAPSAAPSAPYTWKNVKVGGGGFIPGIVFSPIEKDLVYLRSDMGGAYRWNAPSGEWIPLHDQLRESSYFGTESVAPDPVDPNVVYLAVGMSGREPAAMMRSLDRGKTWDIFPVEFKMGGNENGRGVGEPGVPLAGSKRTKLRPAPVPRPPPNPPKPPPGGSGIPF